MIFGVNAIDPASVALGAAKAWREPSAAGKAKAGRSAAAADLSHVKRLADAHRHELGFVLLPSLREQIERGQLLVAVNTDAPDHADPVGFVDFHRRRDGQVTLYHIIVASPSRAQGVGRALLEALAGVARRADCTRITLKCPVDLPANEFYRHNGFRLEETLDGRKRALNMWVLEL